MPQVSQKELAERAPKLSIPALLERASNGRESRNVVEILLVDDNPQDAQLTTRALEKARILNQPHVVSDGVATVV